LVLRDGQTISCYDVDKVVQSVLIEEMVGRKVENLYPKVSHVDASEEVFRVEHLSVPHPNIRGRYIVEDLSFNLKKGEILGIGGLVGAGRSESLGAIFGQYTHNVTKDVYIHGKKVEINTPADAIANGIGFITEERKRNGIIWMLSIRDNISVASLDKLSHNGFMDAKLEEAEVGKLSEELRIKAPSLDTKLIQLSGGNQQKVILAKWLLNNPAILFMDEPTKGIDVGTKADFYRLMSELTEQGVSIVMVSSDMPELVSMSDRCLVISNGHITAELVGDDINEVNVMKAAIAD
jgi:ABC-type sugar transport system ATPase subunit